MDITKDIKYLGVNDHEVDLFESQYKVPNGMSYNSYLIDGGDKTLVMDAVDSHFISEWLDNIASELNGRTPDYLWSLTTLQVSSPSWRNILKQL